MSEQQATEIYRQHRPKLWKHVVGQEDAVRVLDTFLKNNKVPHAILFSGPSGCGKTTCARILRTKLKCGDADFEEINCAALRGIDTIREIQQRMNFAPRAGECRVFLLDECFAPGTMVQTENGSKPIQNMLVGDIVHNVAGFGRVSSVFKNKVSLDRIVRLTFDDGTIIYTTKQHEFLTDSGWVESQNLSFEDCISSIFCYPMNKETPDFIGGCIDELPDLRETYQNKTEPDMQPAMWLEVENSVVWSELDEPTSCDMDKENMRMVQGGVSSQACEKTSKSMQLEMLRQTKSAQFGAGKVRGSDLSSMFTDISRTNIEPQQTLQHVMCMQKSQSISRVSGQTVHQENSKEDKPISQIIFQDPPGKSSGQRIREEDSTNHAKKGSEHDGKNAGHQSGERNLACVFWETRGQRSANKTPEKAERCLGEEMANRICHTHQKRTDSRNQIPQQLQSGFSEAGHQTSSRSRWEDAPTEKDYVTRCQENPTARKVRLVSYEVYEPGNNDQLFAGVLSDKDKSRGFVEFYDLEISGHSSYFANGLPVHNCHRLTPDASSSLLKMLEDTPSHVYFMLCTTDPQKILKAIITRCTEVRMKQIEREQMLGLIADSAKKMEKEIPLSVQRQIVDIADGSARQALVLLHQVLEIEGEENQLAVLVNQDVKRQAFEIVKALLWEKTTWAEVAKLLKTVDTSDPERLRHYILACANTELLKGGKNSARAYLVAMAFSEAWYSCPEVGLARSCYEVLGN